MGYFEYGEEAIAHLKVRDKKLGEYIDKIGYIRREVVADLFAAVVNSIVGQQISTKAQVTVWGRICDMLGEVTLQNVLKVDRLALQSCGISYRKVEYIKDFAKKVDCGEFDIEKVWHMTDSEVIEQLSALRGIGVWTAEMIMIFCMQRGDILSYGDAAILRGLRMVYRHKVITRELFDRYRRRYSPYCSVASLYLWEIASGAIPGLTDPATGR